MSSRLPDFVIAGAPRAGTTSMARYLDAHPALYMAPGKELRFFDNNYEEGIEWYARHFAEAPAGTLVGEASPMYMFRDAAVRRMAHHIPDAQIIVSLREPVDRLWSHYWMRRERGLEPKSFADVIDTEIDLFASDGHDANGLYYLRTSLYAPYLRKLLELYDRSQLEVVVFERMADDPAAAIAAIYAALGVDDSIIPDNVGSRVNSYTQFRSLKVRALTKRLNNGLLQRLLGRLNTRRDADYPEVPDEYRRRLAEIFEPQRPEIEEILGDRIQEWAPIT